MIGFVRKNKKVFTCYDVGTFYAYYNRTSLSSKITKLDDEYYYLNDKGFKKVDCTDIVVFNKNNVQWQDDNEIIKKEEFDNKFAIIEVPWLSGFLMSFRFHMNFDAMMKVYETMLNEFKKEDSGDIDNLKSQLEWLLDNQDVFKYIID